MTFAVYHKTLGGHVHIKVFSGPHAGARGCCGHLTMRIEEWEAFERILTNTSEPISMEVINEDGSQEIQH